jgi:Ni/Fe-hydrogenase subunit HybB-like protein
MVIMAGVIFSTMHQSSLGTMFLLVPHKLSAIWYTPMLPILFLMSSIMSGLAMVLLVMALINKFAKFQVSNDVLNGLGGGLTYAILIYFVIKSVDLVIRGAAPEVLTISTQSIAFWIEIGVGLFLPIAILMTPELATSRVAQIWAGLFVVFGVVLNRLNVAVTGISAEHYPQYVPHWMEIAISAGLLSGAVLVYAYVCRNFPILQHKGHGDPNAPKAAT